MRRALVLMAVVVCILLCFPGQAVGSETQANLVIWPGIGEIVHENAIQLCDDTACASLYDAAAAFGVAARWIDDAAATRPLIESQFAPHVVLGSPNEPVITSGKTVYEPEIIETATNVDIVVRSSQPNRGSVRLDSPAPDTMELVVDFEDSFFGFDLTAVSIESELISGFRASRLDGHLVRMVFDLRRFNGYSVLKGPDDETIIRLPKTEQSALYGKTIVIDPGHGSFPSQHPEGDPGADRSLDGEVVWEKDLNLAVALKLRDILLEAGANPVLTRDADIGLSLSDRYQAANREGADAFISIHHNSSRVQWTRTSGVEIYHRSGDALSKALAESLGWALPKVTGQTLAYVGIHRAFLLGVLEGSRVPSVLIEVGFMNCLDELRSLVTDDFQTRAATGMFNGIASFFSGDPPERSHATGSAPQAASLASTRSGADFLTELTSNLPEVDLRLLEMEMENRVSGFPSARAGLTGEAE